MGQLNEAIRWDITANDYDPTAWYEDATARQGEMRLMEGDVEGAEPYLRRAAESCLRGITGERS